MGMASETKHAQDHQERETVKLGIADVFTGAGILLLAAGIWLLGGLAWALVTVGVILLGIGLAGAMLSAGRGGGKS